MRASSAAVSADARPALDNRANITLHPARRRLRSNECFISALHSFCSQFHAKTNAPMARVVSAPHRHGGVISNVARVKTDTKSPCEGLGRVIQRRDGREKLFSRLLHQVSGEPGHRRVCMRPRKANANVGRIAVRPEDCEERQE